MMNIVEKYAVDSTTEGEDGVVAIEYVMVAAAIVAALAAIFTLFGTTLTARLDGIINSI